jgi:predicted enzyme related to lactoylglutathione lyase
MTSSPDALTPANVAALATIIIYARDVAKTVAFYRHYFGFETTGEPIEGLVELNARQGGASILVHQAARSVKLGQVGVKLSFTVQDVEQFVQAAQAQGLTFGAIHQAHGYQFANAKDPDHNSISISSRAFRTAAAV